MDCYTPLPSENRFGLSRYNRLSDTPSPLINSSTNRIESPNYLNKINNDTTNSFLSHKRNSSPVRYPQHQYPPSYKMPPSTLLPTPAPTTPINYYPYNFDANYTRNYLPRPVSNFSPTPVDQFKNSLERINGCVSSSIPGPIEEYYRNTHYNYSQPFNNYGKLNVPKSSYYNHHLGLPPHRTSHIPAPSPAYYPTPRNEYYDPIAGLHQTVRNGFKDNVGLPNTYHNIYNYSPPLTTHLKRPHYPTPYNPHHPQPLYPNSYPGFPSYNAKSTSFDYYRSHYTQLTSYPEYQTTNSAQYHLYQQQQQHQQLLQNKHNTLQHNSLYHNSYSNPITLSNENLNHQVELMHSPRLSEYNRIKNIEENSENRLQSLINEELRPLSSNLEQNNLSNNEKKFSDSLEDLPLEINKNNRDDIKIEQRAESSISESNTVNDMNSETTIASSPLTSVSSYTDSGISGCSNIIDGNNTSDGSIVEEKPDENNINQINSNNTEEDSNEIKLEPIDAKINNDNLNEVDKLNNKKQDESDPKVKAHVMPSNTSSKESKIVSKKDNQPDRNVKPFSDNCSNEKYPVERNNADFHLHQMPYKGNCNKNSQISSSKNKNARHQRDNNNTSRVLKNDSLQSEYKKSNPSYWSSYQHYQYQSARLKAHRDDNSQKYNNNKNSNKNNAKTNASLNISKNRVLECDFIPSKKSRKKSGFGNCLNDSIELREEIKDIKPLPAFQQAFGSTEIGRFSEIFQNNSPESSYNFNTSYDYNSIDNGSPYSWEASDSLDGSHYRNFYKNSLHSNYIENYDTMESLKENYFNSFD